MPSQFESKNFPYAVKSSNPKRWRNWVFMPRESISYFSGMGWRGMQATVEFFGLTEADGASIDNFRDLAEAVNDAALWSAKVCGGRMGRGAALELLSAESKADHNLFVFPVFMRDKDRAQIHIKVYTDAIHGGSVVMWCNPLKMSDLASMAQFKLMLFRAVDFAITEAKRYTTR